MNMRGRRGEREVYTQVEMCAQCEVVCGGCVYICVLCVVCICLWGGYE